MRRIPFLSFIKMIIIAHLLTLKEVQATHGSLEDCYACARKDSNRRYICNWEDNPTVERNHVACCTEGNQSPYCKSNPGYNKCSQPFYKMEGMFYNYCPGITENLCGKMNLQASASKAEITNNKMKYSVAKGRFDACYYVITKDNITHGDGNIQVRIKQMQNVKLSMHKGKNAMDLEGKSLLAAGTYGSPGSTYNTENSDGLIVSVHVRNEDQDSSFSLEYWTDAPDADLFQQFERWIESLGGLKWFFVGCLGCVGMLILCCFGVCICQCMKTKKVHHGLPETEFSTNAGLNNNDRFGPTNDVEMVMESVGNSNGDDTHSQDDKELDTRSYHGIQKEDKNSRQAEINFQRTNPFAQVGQKKLKENQTQ